MTSRVHHFMRRIIPQTVSRAVSAAMDSLPGHGMYREDRVRLLTVFLLEVADRCASDGGIGPESTSSALRRLADLVDAGEVSTALERVQETGGRAAA